MLTSAVVLCCLWLAGTSASPIPQSEPSEASAPVTAPSSGYPIVVYQNDYTSAPHHGPYSGTPTVTGAANAPATLAPSIPAGPPNPTATYYNREGVPINPMPAPYTPSGGLGTNGSLPRYMVESDFDFESIALGLYQEWIELDLFHDGLARFSKDELQAAGLGPEARSLIEFMADQESGHATLLANMLGEAAPKECVYNYPYTTVNGSTSCSASLASVSPACGVSSTTSTLAMSGSCWRNPLPPRLDSSKSSASCRPDTHGRVVRERVAAIVGLDHAGALH